MLSDGDATSGETNWINIRANVLEANIAANTFGKSCSDPPCGRFAIFTFAIGTSAPYADLESLSNNNGGLARQIFDHRRRFL